MHHTLERQLKKRFSDKFHSPEFEAFLKVVSDTYDNYDKDRKLLERSFDISSKEFLELNNKVLKLLEELKIEKESIEQKVVERTKELTLANERLMQLDKVKTEFISVAAHQLRTPLSAIKWTLSLLIDENSNNLTSEQKSALLKGYESNERMINLVNEMLVVTRIESGKIQYKFSLIRLEDLIDSVIIDFTWQARLKNISLVFEKPEKEPRYVKADSEKIRAVIQNLIENALNYTTSGKAITISIKQEGNFVKVFVKDNGIGIPTSQQSSIFNKFFRADNAIKTKTDGSGLGLFIAKSIVDIHKGQIGFESEEGKGSTFYFAIPFADVET